MNPINTKSSAADTRAVLETQMTQQINQYFDNIAPGIYLRQKTREKRKQLRMMKKRTKLVTLRLGNLRQLDTNQSHSRCSFSNKTKHLLTVSDIKKVAKQDPPCCTPACGKRTEKLQSVFFYKPLEEPGHTDVRARHYG